VSETELPTGSRVVGARSGNLNVSRQEVDWPVLRDGDLLLRALRAGDAADWLAGEDDEQRRWLWHDASRHSTPEDVVEAIVRWRASWQSHGQVRHWGVFVQPDTTLVGGVELRDRGDRLANLSYVVFPAARRRHVATRAVRLATDWALTNLPVDGVVAIVDPNNHASIGVAQAAGFAADGTAGSSEHDSSAEMLRLIFPARSRT
jgi:RimJ/RimL family protein N-acetyltransferase